MNEGTFLTICSLKIANSSLFFSKNKLTLHSEYETNQSVGYVNFAVT